ncbi:unnamed protein product [Schistocephalus solidus]|uniref:Secreted phosphoprotein 24 n=1 Tax=Schistocephalus solidus TaxID=70667 RepID=A0A183TLN3_SCHSO|nr:unnamed protein product [Schistocephalus solidus]
MMESYASYEGLHRAVCVGAGSCYYKRRMRTGIPHNRITMKLQLCLLLLTAIVLGTWMEVSAESTTTTETPDVPDLDKKVQAPKVHHEHLEHEHDQEEDD